MTSEVGDTPYAFLSIINVAVRSNVDAVHSNVDSVCDQTWTDWFCADFP